MSVSRRFVMNKIDTFPSVLHFFFFYSFQHGIILSLNVFVGSMHMALSMPPSLWWRGEHTRQCLGGGLTSPAPFTFSTSVGEADGWFVAVKVQPSCEFSERQQRCFFSLIFRRHAGRRQWGRLVDLRASGMSVKRCMLLPVLARFEFFACFYSIWRGSWFFAVCLWSGDVFVFLFWIFEPTCKIINCLL